MLGYKAKVFITHPCVCLDSLVPPDNFYRQVETKLDLTFVRDLVRPCYASYSGRPSIDPVVFFKLQLIMFFEGIRSERQLMDMVDMRLDLRWYLGYDFGDPVPNHSSLSRIRERYGLEVFQRFFERIVELCIEADLVWGKELYFDGTKARANAAIDSLVPTFYFEAQQQAQAPYGDDCETEKHAQPALAEPEQSARISRTLVEKYDGTQFPSHRHRWYKRTADRRISLTDPSASPMSRFTGDVPKLGYHTHYVVDGGKARIILAALVTPASVMDNTPMLDLARWVRFRWRLRPTIAVADTKYGTIANVTGLEQDGLRAYIPTPDLSQRNAFFSRAQFHYNPERDLFTCPAGQELPLYKRSYSELEWVYRPNPPTLCDACPLKPQCTDSKSGRHLRRSFFQDYLDRVNGYRDTEAYRKALRKRQVWVEPLFGEGKQWHGMARFRLRGLHKVNIEGLMKAAGQNIKRLLNAEQLSGKNAPAGVPAIQLRRTFVFAFLH